MFVWIIDSEMSEGHFRGFRVQLKLQLFRTLIIFIEKLLYEWLLAWFQTYRDEKHHLFPQGALNDDDDDDDDYDMLLWLLLLIFNTYNIIILF